MLGETIAKLRKNKGISQEELAEVLLTSRQAVSKWERGESDPDIDRLKDLATFFNVSIDYLLGFDIESTSVNSFINRIDKCLKEGNYDITLNEIRMVVSINKNNFNLYISIIEYLSDYYFVSRNEEIIDLVIEYIKRAISLYQVNNPLKVSLNDLHKSVAEAYILKQRHELAKKYIEENDINNVKGLLLECEFELGNYQEAEKIASDNFLDGVAIIATSNIIQIRLLMRKNEEKEALDLAKWSIDFIKSISKSIEPFLDYIYMLYFIEAVCEKSLGLDYINSLNFLKENYDKTTGYRSDNDGLKFYKNKRVMVSTINADIKEEILKEINDLKEGGFKYKDFLEIFNEVYGGNRNGRRN